MLARALTPQPSPAHLQASTQNGAGKLAVLQTLPADADAPLHGVIIDREDRRRLVMMLDAARAVVILIVAVSRFPGRGEGLALYLMKYAGTAGLLGCSGLDHRGSSGLPLKASSGSQHVFCGCIPEAG